MKSPLTRISKVLSLMLRHDPGRFGVALDPQGWVSVDEVLSSLSGVGFEVDRSVLEEVVTGGSKRRFEISPDDPPSDRIRAVHGHNRRLAVNLESEVTEPPAQLYHGTVARFVDSILEQGLVPRERQHVHLSSNLEMAREVGGRRGKPVILQVASGEMFRAGSEFYLSTSGVWLTASVPPQYLSFLAE